MKKVLSWILLLTLVLGLFAGCRGTQNDVTTEPDSTISEGDIDGINAAMDYLKTIYKNTEEAQKTSVDYTRYGVVRIAGVPYEVVWTVDVSEEFVQIIVNDDGTVTIHIVKAGEEDTPYTLTATISDAEGNSVSHSWDMVIPAAVDMVSIVKEAYALKSGESMDHEVTLTGKIISIDTAYDPDYKNITVTIEVEGAEDMPIKCYRLKGEGAEELCVGDTITVTGTIKNYNGTIEFDTGCVLSAVVPGDRVKAPEDMKEIVDQAYALGANKSLPYEATLTGTVTMIKTAYDASYGNITVEMVVEGRENYPILCYRLKGSGVESIGVNDIITVTGYIINYVGDSGKSTIEYTTGCKLVSWIDKPGPVVPSDPKQIVDQAYALGANKTLPYEATLTGKITAVTRAYDPSYGNVSVKMVVEGREDKPIVCYNMTGNGIASIDIGDTITVRGYIENYVGDKGYSTVEFNRPTLVSYKKSDVKVPTDPVEIVKAAYALKAGDTLPYKATLTGKVTKITSAYDASYKNITVIIEVEGAEDMPIKCYRMKGDGVEKIAVGDTITVTGYIVKYQHESGDTEVEYNAGCQMTNRVSGGGVVPTTPTVPNGEYVKNPQTGVAYKLGIYNGKGIYLFTGKTDGVSYRLATTQDSAKAIDVYVEQTSGGYYLYFMDGTTKTYIRTYERTSTNDKGQEVKSGSLELVTSAPKEVYTYNTALNTFVTTVGENFYYLGTYSTFTNISGQKSYYVTGENAGNVDVSQFPARLYPADIKIEETTTEPTTKPTTPTTPGSGSYTVATEIAAETAYKLGVNIGTKTLYFNGKTKSADTPWYLTTTEDAKSAVDVKLEAVNGGYLLYFMDGNTKTYIHVYERTKDDGSKSGTMELTTTKPTDVYTLNEVYNTLVYVASETNSYYIGTYYNSKYQTTYETLSVSNLSYLNASNVDSTQFPARLYVYSTGAVDPTQPSTTEPTEPETTEPTEPTTTAPSVPSGEYAVVTEIAAETAYKLGVNIGTKTLYFNGKTKSAEQPWYLTTTENVDEAVDVKLETVDGGYLLYFMDSETKTYIDVYERQSGEAGKGKGSLQLVTEKPDHVLTLDEAFNTLVYVADVNNSYYVGTYKWTNKDDGTTGIYETLSVSNLSYVSTSNVDVSQFPARLYAQSAGITEPDPEPTTTEPTTTAPNVPSGEYAVVTEIAPETAYKLGVNIGTKTLYFNGKTKSAEQPWYLTTTENVDEAVDVKLETVDGGYLLYFMDGETKTYIDVYERQSGEAGKGKGSLQLVTEKPNHVLTLDEAYNTLVYAADANNSYYVGTYKWTNKDDGTTGIYETLSVSNLSYVSTSNVDVSQFPARLYAQSAGTTEPDPEPTPSANGFNKVTAEQSDYSGTYLLVSEDLNQAFTSTFESLNTPVANGTAITVTGGVIEANDANKAIVITLEKVEGGYLLKTADGRYLSRSGSSTGFDITTEKESAGIVNVAWENGNVKITGVGGAVFCVDNYNGKNRFVFLATKYLNDSYPVYLYKLTDTEEPEPDDGTVSIATALAGTDDETFKVKGVVTLVDGQNIYVQDETGAICLRMTEAPSDISLGNTIIGTGSKSVFNGLTQLQNATYEKSNGMTLKAKETTIGALTTADICTYIKLTGVTVTEVYDNNGAYTYPNITVKDSEGNTIQLYKAVIEKKDSVWSVKVGDVLNVYAAVGYFNKFQLRNTVAAEVGVVTSGGSTETPEETTTQAPTTDTPSAATSVKYTFAATTEDAGTQFAQNEVHKMDDVVTVISNGAHYTVQLRIYSLTDKNVTNCHAIIQSAKVIKSIAFTAGYKTGTLNVYGSVDGENYTLIQGISITATSYNSYTLDMPDGTAYKYLKLESPTSQTRIQDMTITFAE